MKICCGLCDHPSATLVEDLKERGMLDDTLVVWGGEFGRPRCFRVKAPPPGVTIILGFFDVAGWGRDQGRGTHGGPTSWAISHHGWVHVRTFTQPSSSAWC
ncbi:MAG: hypothetical protein CM1200mP34_0010 [Verrucomicrobiales bacterium]|nr:MAG: hypothetical protein CM1200mP34_0010 [Verrucomicrobiales bacterium]